MNVANCQWYIWLRHLLPFDDLWQMFLNCCMEDTWFLFGDEILRLPSIFTKKWVDNVAEFFHCLATTGEEIQVQAADPFYQKCLINNQWHKVCPDADTIPKALLMQVVWEMNKCELKELNNMKSIFLLIHIL